MKLTHIFTRMDMFDEWIFGMHKGQGFSTLEFCGDGSGHVSYNNITYFEFEELKDLKPLLEQSNEQLYENYLNEDYL